MVSIVVQRQFDFLSSRLKTNNSRNIIDIYCCLFAWLVGVIYLFIYLFVGVEIYHSQTRHALAFQNFSLNKVL